MAKIASHLVCPYLFNNLEKYKNRRKWKRGGKGGRDALVFGEVFKLYIAKKLEETEPVSTEVDVNYIDVRGRCDITTINAAIEVKYSTQTPVSELLELGKPQAVFYAMALGKNKAVVYAGNPMEDKIKKEVIEGENFTKWQNYILAVINGYSKPRETPYCKFCPIRAECPLYKEKKDDNNKKNRKNKK